MAFWKMKYKERSGRWAGYAPLPAFAAHGTLAPEEPLTEENSAATIEDLNKALDNMKELMRQKFGDQIDAAFAAMEAEQEAAFDIDAQGEDPKEIERERRRTEKQARRAAKLAAGKFPFYVPAPDGAEPSESQQASFRFLAENEAAVVDAVLKEVWDSFENAYSQEHWRRMASLKPAASLDELRGTFALSGVTVTREHRDGFSHLVFDLESNWQDEHGLMVVYSPDSRMATWTSYDGLDDLTPSDEPIGDTEEYVETPHDELVNAIFAGEDDRAKELIAAGADINDVDPNQLPPLCLAVEQLEPENVRRLLAFGADPKIADAETGRTPLKMAKRTYREMGFAPSKKKDEFIDSMMGLLKGAAGAQFAEMKQRLDDIIAALEEAEA
jgi:hypothetical protein